MSAENTLGQEKSSLRFVQRGAFNWIREWQRYGKEGDELKEELIWVLNSHSRVTGEVINLHELAEETRCVIKEYEQEKLYAGFVGQTKSFLMLVNELIGDGLNNIDAVIMKRERD